MNCSSKCKASFVKDSMIQIIQNILIEQETIFKKSHFQKMKRISNIKEVILHFNPIEIKRTQSKLFKLTLSNKVKVSRTLGRL